MNQKEDEGITNTNDFLGAVEARARHRGYEIGSRYARNVSRCSDVGGSLTTRLHRFSQKLFLRKKSVTKRNIKMDLLILIVINYK